MLLVNALSLLNTFTVRSLYAAVLPGCAEGNCHQMGLRLFWLRLGSSPTLRTRQTAKSLGCPVLHHSITLHCSIPLCRSTPLCHSTTFLPSHEASQAWGTSVESRLQTALLAEASENEEEGYLIVTVTEAGKATGLDLELNWK